MRARISARMLNSANAKPTDRPFEIRDDLLKGFLVRVQPSGVRTYYLQIDRSTRIRIAAVGVLTPDEARERATKILGNTAHGRTPLEGITGGAGDTLGNFIEEHYLPWLQVNRPRSADDTENRLTSNFGSWFARPLSAISIGDIEAWKVDRYRAGRKPATAMRGLMALSGVMTRAVKLKRITENPVKGADKPRLDRSPKVRFLDDAEEARLRGALVKRDAMMIAKRRSANEWRRARKIDLLAELPYFGDHLTPAVLVSMNTGLRRGELLALRWSDVDLRDGMLTLQASTTKSGQTRYLPLNSEARSVLARWKEQAQTERVFSVTTSFKSAWGELLRGANITGFRWHDLRHHFASRLAQRAVPLNVIRELLGHGSLAMTLRYAHLSPDTRRTAVELLDTPIPSREVTK